MAAQAPKPGIPRDHGSRVFGGPQKTISKRRGGRAGGGASLEFQTSKRRLNARLIVENLPPHVTTEDIKEIFTQIGPVSKALLLCDDKGRPQGQAHVEFKKSEDTEVAYRKFNNLKVDGQPMTLHVIGASTGFVGDPTDEKAKAPRGAGAPKPKPKHTLELQSAPRGGQENAHPKHRDQQRQNRPQQQQQQQRQHQQQGGRPRQQQQQQQNGSRKPGRPNQQQQQQQQQVQRKGGNGGQQVQRRQGGGQQQQGRNAGSKKQQRSQQQPHQQSGQRRPQQQQQKNSQQQQRQQQQQQRNKKKPAQSLNGKGGPQKAKAAVAKGKGKAEPKPTVSIQDLNKQMESYKNKESS